MTTAATAASQPPAGQAADTPRPAAAVIALDGSPLAALFESRLIENRRATWLERAKIDEILREQKLTALLAPESGRQRADVGRLLKADVLVLFEQAAEPEPHVRLVVCETRQGLRLAVHQVVLSSDAEADVRQLTALADQALSNFGQEVREIVAVPPFVSNDLNYDHEYLKGAYATLAELAASGQPGLLTVELEEAQAIGRELTIAGERQLGARALPLYLLGEFRHEGQGEKFTATIRIRMLRGEKELAAREQKGLSPSDTTKLVQQAAGELVAETAGVQPQPPAARLEAKQLAQRAEVFYHLGHWEEAVALAEAAVLLDNEQQRARKVAIASLARLASMRNLSAKDADALARRSNLYLRALEHLDVVFPTMPTYELHGDSGALTGVVAGAAAWHVAKLSDPEAVPIAGVPDGVTEQVWKTERELRKRELDIITRMLRTGCRTHPGYVWWLIDRATCARPTDERFEITLAAVRAVQDLPNARDLAHTLMDRGVWTPNNGHRMPPDLADRYLEGLSAIENQGVRAEAYETLYRRFMRVPAYLSERPPSESWPESLLDSGKRKGLADLLSRAPLATQGLRFEPIVLPDQWPRQQYVNNTGPHANWIPAGPGIDVILGAPMSGHSGPINELFLHEVPGGLNRILDFFDRASITDVAYDGRFVWIAVRRFDESRKPQLMVVDPRTEKVFPISEDDGLPVVDSATIPKGIPLGQAGPVIYVEPLEPGRVFLVSWFGRLAIGTARFDPDKGAEFDVFFEARHEPDRAAGEPWRDIRMATQPHYVIALQGTASDGKPLRRVLVGAGGRDSHPLVVDPDLRKVELLPATIDRGLNVPLLVREPDAIYRLAFIHSNIFAVDQYHLERIALPDLVPETLITGLPQGVLLKFGDRFVILGGLAWLLDPGASPEKRIQQLAIQPPGKQDFIVDPFTENVPFRKPRLLFGVNDGPDRMLPFDFKQICCSSHFGIVAERVVGNIKPEYYRVVLEDDVSTNIYSGPTAAARVPAP